MSEIALNKDNFEAEVINHKGLVLVDFWASWCGPCQMLGPVVSELAEEYAGTLKVGKVNVDEEMELAQAFHVSSIPLVVLFKDGKVVNHHLGYAEKSVLEKLWK